MSTTPTHLAALGLLLVGACASGDPDGPDAPTGAEVLQTTLDAVVVPDLTAFATSVTALHDEVATFCTGPDAAGLTTVQDAWRDAALRWNGVAAYNLGPLDHDPIVPRILFIESMRQRGTDYTDTVREELGRALDGTDPLDDAYFDSLTFTKVGLLALEVLAFEDSRNEGTTTPADVLADFLAAPRKCTFLEGVAARLATTATEVDEGWRIDDGTGTPFRDTMLGPELEDGSEPVAALVIALFEHFDYLKTRKLEGILDAQLSGQFYPQVGAGIDGLARFLDLTDQPDETSLLDLMALRGFEDEATAVRDHIAQARTAAASEAREDLTTAVGLLEGDLKRGIPDSLGIFLGITFADGD